MIIWFAAAIDKNNYGGVRRVMEDLSQGLEQRNHMVDLIYADKALLKNYLVFSLYLMVRLVLTRVKPDWIIARSTDGVFCALMCKIFRLKTRIALHNHGWEEKVYECELRLPAAILNAPTTWRARVVRFPLLRLTLTTCSLCLCGTIDEIRWICKQYPDIRSKMRYVPNSVTVQPVAYWCKKPQVPLSILSTGPDTWKKNVRHTLSIFAIINNKLPECRLSVVGTGKHSDILQPHSKSLQNNCMFFNSLPFSAMIDQYTQSPYFISSSRYEGGHSLAILEAMACGCIVFVSSIASSCEIVRHGHNGFLINGSNAAEDAHLIITIISKPAEELSAIRVNAVKTAGRNNLVRQINRLSRCL